MANSNLPSNTSVSHEVFEFIDIKKDGDTTEYTYIYPVTETGAVSLSEKEITAYFNATKDSSIKTGAHASDILSKLSSMAYKGVIDVSDFDTGIVTDSLDITDDLHIASAKAINTLKEHLINLNEEDPDGIQAVYAPSEGPSDSNLSRFLAFYNPSTKTWDWSGILGKISSLILNGTDMSTMSGTQRIYAPTTSGSSGQVPVMGSTYVMWLKPEEFMRLNGASNSQVSNGTDYSGIYAPTSSGSKGQILQSSGNGQAPVWADQRNKIRVNNASDTDEVHIYAPTSSGSKGQILQSSGNGEPVWITVSFNADGTISTGAVGTVTADSDKPVTSRGVYEFVNGYSILVDGVPFSFSMLKENSIYAPFTQGNNGQVLVSSGSKISAPVWKNHGSYTRAVTLQRNNAHISLIISTPEITSEDKITVKAGLNTLASGIFKAVNMDEYAYASAYVSGVYAIEGNTEVTVNITLRNTISVDYPMTIEVTFS